LIKINSKVMRLLMALAQLEGNQPGQHAERTRFSVFIQRARGQSVA
jgi:hypothetical protein